MSESQFFQAVAIYDFESNVEGKLSFKANEVVTVLASDIGNGWWQAKNSKSEIGLIPNSYFKALQGNTTPTLSAATSNTTADSGYRSLPKPPSPHHSTSSSSSSKSSFNLPPRPPPKPARLFLTQNYVSSSSSSSSPPQSTKLSKKSAVAIPLSDTDEWDEDEDQDDQIKNTEDLQKQDDSSSYYMRDFDDEDDEEEEDDDFRSQTKLVGITTGNTDKYLFDMEPAPLPDNIPHITIYDSFEGPVWSFETTSKTYKVHSPRKESKFKGVKNFVNYRISSSTSQGQDESKAVYRRYKQFDWLYNRLVDKYSTILVPPLPDKQLSGRFEDDFIKQRQRLLNSWISRVSRHPVLSNCEAFVHFVSASHPEEWKAGKRRVEKDKYKGAFLFYTIDPPALQLDSIDVEIQLDKFSRYVKCMEDSVRHVCRTCSKTSLKQKLKFRKDFRGLGTSFDNLSNSLQKHTYHSGSKSLSSAVSYTGKTYNEISLLFGVQCSKDLLPLQEKLASYKSLLSLFPEILLVQRSTTNKIQETAGHLSRQEVAKVQARVDVITYSVMAEIQHFQMNRVIDINTYMKEFLKEQIIFYNKIASHLKQALTLYENVS